MNNLAYVQSEDDDAKRGRLGSLERYQGNPYLDPEIKLQEIENTKIKDTHNGGTASKVSLKKDIGFISCVGILVGGIIGSGIFITPKGVLIGSGSVGSSLIIWALCGGISIIGSLACAELGILIPHSGGPYVYLLEAFDPIRKTEKSRLGSMVAFLYFWQSVVFSRPAGFALQGIASANYIIHLLKLSGHQLSLNERDSDSLVRLIAAIFIMTIHIINCHSNKISTSVINTFTFLKLVAVTFLIIAGLVRLCQGENLALKTGFEGSTFTTSGISLAFYSGLFAYGGWDSLNYVTKELRNPKKDLLRSLMTTCILITVVYMLVNVAYFAVLSKEEFLASDAVAVDFSKKIDSGIAAPIYIGCSVVCSIFGASFGGVFTTARLSYAAAREGHMVDFMSYIHYTRMTPVVAIALSITLSLLMLPYSTILGIISLAGQLESIFSLISMIALIILRRRHPRKDGDFRAPFWVPYVMVAVWLFLIIGPMVEDQDIGQLFAILLIVSGIAVYFVFVYFKKTPRVLNKVRIIIQKLFLVLPPEDEM